MTQNYLIGSSLVQHAKQFGKIVDGKTPEAASFKQGGTPRQMKDYILSKFTEQESGSHSLSRKASQSVRRAFLELSSSSPSTSSSSSSSSTSGSYDEQHKRKVIAVSKQSNTKTRGKSQPTQHKDIIVQKNSDTKTQPTEHKDITPEKKSETKPKGKTNKGKRKAAETLKSLLEDDDHDDQPETGEQVKPKKVKKGKK